MADEFTEKNGLFLVAEDKDQIIGYFRGSIDTSPGYVEPKKIGTVYDLLVTKKYRRQGVGEQLFKEALAWFQNNKIKHIELNVGARNNPGIQFWRKFGFGDYKIRMRLDLE